MKTPIVVEPTPEAMAMLDTFADILARNSQPEPQAVNE